MASDRRDLIGAPVVCDASPLIALDRTDSLGLVIDLFGTLLVPPAVAREVGPSIRQRAELIERLVTRPFPALLERAQLGPGETEALVLAQELRGIAVLLDDQPARRLAQSLEIFAVGTLGVLLLAKQQGLIRAVQPDLDALLMTGFRVGSDLYDHTLRLAGERT